MNEPDPKPSDTPTPRSKTIVAMFDRAFLNETGYEHRLALREGARIGIEDLERDLAAANATIAEKERKLSEAKANRNECATHCDELLAERDTLRTTIARLEEENRGLRIGLAGKEANATSIAKALGDVTEDRDRLSAELCDLRREAAEMKPHYKALEAEVARLTQERDALKQPCQAQELGSRTLCKCQVCTGFQRIASELSSLRAERDAAQKQIDRDNECMTLLRKLGMKAVAERDANAAKLKGARDILKKSEAHLHRDTASYRWRDERDAFLESIDSALAAMKG